LGQAPFPFAIDKVISESAQKAAPDHVRALLL
jgi:hypothetical protein